MILTCNCYSDMDQTAESDGIAFPWVAILLAAVLAMRTMEVAVAYVAHHCRIHACESVILVYEQFDASSFLVPVRDQQFRLLGKVDKALRRHEDQFLGRLDQS